MRLDLSHDLGAPSASGQRPAAPADRQERAGQLAHPAHGGGYYKFVNETHRRASVGLQHHAVALPAGSGRLHPGSGATTARKGTSRLGAGQLPAAHAGLVLGAGRFRFLVPLPHRRQPSLPLEDLPHRFAGQQRPQQQRLRLYPERRGGAPADRALAHRRAGVDIQQADDHAPSHATSSCATPSKPWQDLDMPPRPRTPYADFD